MVIKRLSIEPKMITRFTGIIIIRRYLICQKVSNMHIIYFVRLALSDKDVVDTSVTECNSIKVFINFIF